MYNFGWLINSKAFDFVVQIFYGDCLSFCGDHLLGPSWSSVNANKLSD